MMKIANLSSWFDQNKPTRKSRSPFNQIEKIGWVDCEDVYQPIAKLNEQFTKDKSIAPVFSQVYIRSEVNEAIALHLEEDLLVERGGILFGHAYTDPSWGIYVEIVASVAAPATLGSGTRLEFTPASWQGIMDYVKSARLEGNIMGWYHSHPGMGVFMSETDKRTQQAFFSHPWCLSIVCDPVTHEIGYFLGAQAKRVKPVVLS